MRIVQYEKWMRLRDGGVVNSVLNLSEALARRGHAVTLLTADDSGVPQEWARLGHNGRDHPKPSYPSCVVLRLRDRVAELQGRSAERAEWDTLSQLLNGDSMRLVHDQLARADVAHIHGVWTSSNLQVAAAARRLGVPYIVSPHGNLDRQSMGTSPLLKRFHHALLSGRMLNRAHGIHCTSDAEQNEGRVWFRNTNSRVIPLPFDTSMFGRLPGAALARSQFPQLSGAPTVLFLGRLHPIKNIERLLRAAARWRDAGQHVLTVLAGPPATPDYGLELQDLAAHLGIADRCLFVGMVEGQVKLSLYQAADVLVNLSEHENFSLVILEAMCCGTPVITTRQTAIWPALDHSGGSVIIESDQELDKAVARITGKRPGRDHMGELARAWALGYVDVESVMGQYEALLGGAARSSTRAS